MTGLFEIVENRVFLKQEEGGSVPVKGGITGDSFAVIHIFHRGWLPFGYLRDTQGVWWFDGRKTKVTLVSKEADGFRVLDDDYGLDAKLVYLENKPIPGGDPATFRLLPGSPFYAVDQHRLYVKSGDRFHTWDDIDVETAVARQDYCSDKDHVFHLFHSLSYANGSKEELSAWLQDTCPDVRGWWHEDYDKSEQGVEQIQGNWYRTDRAVFYGEETKDARGRNTRQVFNRLRGAHPATFEVLSDSYGRDSVGVYCTWRKVAGADASTFEALGGLFGRDADQVFYNGYPVAGAERDSFESLLSSGYLGLSKDRGKVYHAQFERTEQPFGHPDYILRPIPGADAESFVILSEDAQFRYAFRADGTMKKSKKK